MKCPIREQQEYVLKEIADAINNGHKQIVLEAPTELVSPVGIAVALSLGSSYICTSTKELQQQYKVACGLRFEFNPYVVVTLDILGIYIIPSSLRRRQ
ncbi:hypothetical protein DYY65_05785 [Nitrososphaera sp. AFS]|nr:hypothetical protein [Nitrososphaera sp. AFS]